MTCRKISGPSIFDSSGYPVLGCLSCVPPGGIGRARNYVSDERTLFVEGI